MSTKSCRVKSLLWVCSATHLQGGDYNTFRNVYVPWVLFCARESSYFELSLTPGLLTF